MKDPIVKKWADSGLLNRTTGQRDREILAHSLELLAQTMLQKPRTEQTRMDVFIFPIVTRIVRDNGYRILRGNAVIDLYNDIHSQWEKYVEPFGSEEAMYADEETTRIDHEAEFCALYVQQRGAMYV